MKKLTLAASLLLALNTLNAQADVSNGADGKVTIKGKVVDQTCVVTNDSKDIIVTLPTVQTGSLKTTGATAGKTDFAIQFQNCKAAVGHNQVKAFFLPKSGFTDASGLLENKATSTPATNVKIQLLNADGSVIKAGLNDKAITAADGTELDATQVQGSQSVALTAGITTGKIPYAAQYYATGKAGTGDVQGIVEYNLAYE
ncbi:MULTISPECIES: fimbrial protein [Haemophilus]|uniref:Fimbrial protein n=1 Tax=Haemophilus aegyptius TaxID=197575 RepID=A0ABY1VYP7_HAEAE|nr:MULTISPECIES: fimbrial protein [Haemophilus]EGF16865.1 F17 fimbrial protein [Haemophilus aegyptius ATCC 11116]OBX82294.1 fimbrial protein [Haemophilus aegyptius]TMQ42078.1 fimbrial protein [Haemophilus influenzae biotype aegyptius]UAK82146.1 type 1 fimbrial protein [Haemophilus aegyptius]SQH38057.1 fimbrial protein [Haemophilus aegyptius]